MRLHLARLWAKILKVYNSYDSWPAPIRVFAALLFDFVVVNLAVYLWQKTGVHIESATSKALPWVHDGLTKLEGVGIILLYLIFLIELVRKVVGALFGELATKTYNFLKEMFHGRHPVFIA